MDKPKQRLSTSDSLIVVVFSFNRALQLEYTLRKLRENLICTQMEVAVVYHTRGAKHALAYNRLRANCSAIAFHKIGAAGSFWQDIFPRLFNIRNVYRYVKYPFLRKNRDNFKELTEHIIMKSACGYVMFMTDDMVTFARQPVTQEVFALIAANPLQTSFRCYVGRNHHNAPSGLEQHGSFLKWNYYDPNMSNSWAYPFAVDGTIYDKRALMSVMRPAFYHIPTTLESNIVSNVRARGLFSIGYCPLESSMVGVVLNKVQKLSANRAGNFDVDLLNEKFLDGYRMEAVFERPVDINTIVTNQILLWRGTEEVLVRSETLLKGNGGNL